MLNPTKFQFWISSAQHSTANITDLKPLVKEEQNHMDGKIQQRLTSPVQPGGGKAVYPNGGTTAGGGTGGPKATGSGEGIPTGGGMVGGPPGGAGAGGPGSVAHGLDGPSGPQPGCPQPGWG